MKIYFSPVTVSLLRNEEVEAGVLLMARGHGWNWRKGQRGSNVLATVLLPR